MTLNNKQLEAVKFGDGPLLVLAGAGSGKTRVLTYRIAYLIQEKGIRPDEILAVTFTNKAAQEMKDRVQRLVGADPRSLWISTFHSISLRILRRHANFLGFSNDFNIYDDGDQTSLVKECLRELNLDEKKITPASVVNHISRAKDSLLDPDAYLAKQDHFYGQKVAQVYKLYEEKLKTNQAMDFGDLIYNAVRLFEKNPDALARYQKQFKYILVDEYQDTNHAQYKLISILSKVCRNVFAVGDPDQSIYGWRGAD
ncbi:UvrD-helicase domain-containing protein, partial [bacterium]|nr:UvrD-helicase domain-containing protein [bacterium]